MTTLTVNGRQQECPDGASVAQLVELLAVNVHGLAVERNRRVVPRRRWHETLLEPGDTIELVRIVGGG